MHIDYHVLIDASQDICPIPTIRAKEALDRMSEQQVLKLVASQNGTVRNIRTLVKNNHFELIKEIREGNDFVFYIRKIQIQG